MGFLDIVPNEKNYLVVLDIHLAPNKLGGFVHTIQGNRY